MYLEKYYYEKNIQEEFFKFLYSMTGKKEEIVVICIGDPVFEGNILAPLVGTLLHERNIPNVYGTLKEPVYEINIKEIYNKILKKYDNPYIILVASSFPVDFHDEREVIVLKNDPYEIQTASGSLKLGNASFIVVFDLEDSYCKVNFIEKLGIRKIYKYSEAIFKTLYYILHNKNYVK
ncbi:hypothetical protein BJV85_001915 [Clostridium acetobutylicum]|uniref:Uncharacterized protein, YYAC B.subtilis homolog n=1 Tax=Clostridium acetobutylicum (strain ATCC 824 / DSM 792 / JCM 1419 / IAM 19013 / LMG 5710 / NBRC 13948 / NRRL B-527 / VKM B-1787 / 2291 / W) TaxID=272562 RepID=Q97HQ0_CLOAB